MAEIRTSQDSMDSISSMRQSTDSNENSEEKTIYENLMEIFPLMEDFIKNQGSMTRTSFAHQAPVSFTRAPSRQVPQKRKLEQKPKGTNGEEISPRSGASKTLNIIPLAQDLQRDVEELSNRLRETQLQSTCATKELQSTLESKESQIVEMELMVRRLQKELQRGEQETCSVQMELGDAKDEISRMLSQIQKAESNISQSKNKAAGFEQELLGVQLQLSALHSQVEANDQILSDSLQNVFHGTSSLKSLVQTQNERMEGHRRNADKMELARRAYLAAVIVARETNEESPLTLCAALRFQLQAFLRQTDCFAGSQVNGLVFPRNRLELAVS